MKQWLKGNKHDSACAIIQDHLLRQPAEAPENAGEKLSIHLCKEAETTIIPLMCVQF